jgi:hypothetical protein
MDPITASNPIGPLVRLEILSIIAVKSKRLVNKMLNRNVLS